MLPYRVILVLAVLAFACEAASQPLLERSSFVQELLLTGELEAVQSRAVKAPQTSLFQMRIEFMAEEGTTVLPGEPILSFDSSGLASRVLDLEAQILDAETRIVAKESEVASSLRDLEIELAERLHARDRARLEAEIDPGLIARKAYSERRLALARAEKQLEETRERIEATKKRGKAEADVLVIERDKLAADLEAARQDVDLLTIRSPVEALVVHERRSRSTTRYQPGDSCWPGQAVMRLPDLSEMKAVFHVSEVDAHLIDVGQEVEISLDSFPGRQLTGEVTHVPSMAVKRNEDSKIAIFEVEVRLSETWAGEMKPGMSVLGRLAVDRRENVPCVRRELVRVEGSSYFLKAGDREIPLPPPVARNSIYYVLSEADARALESALRGGVS